MADVSPSDQLLKEVRGAFVTQGISLTAVCNQMNVKRQNAAKALVGDWNGPELDDLVPRILARAGVHK